MKQGIFSIAKYVLLLLVGFGLLWLAFRGVDINSTLNELRETNMFWVLLSVLASLIAFTSRAYRWNMLIKPSGYSPTLYKTSIALMIGYLANLAIPRLGEVTRCGTLSKSANIPFDLLLGTVIVERALDVICLLICVLMTAAITYERLGNFLNENLFEPLGEKLQQVLQSPYFYIVLLSILILSIFYRMNRKKQNAEKQGSLAKLSSMLKGILEGLRSIRKIKNPGAFLFHTILIWVMYFMMSYICFFALPATAGLSLEAGLFVLVVGGMGMSAPVQGGIGAYHILVSQGLLLYGISYEHGLAFATLMHTSQTLTVILFGGIAFILLTLSQRKLSNKNV